MSIPFTKYVNIISGVSGANQVAERSLSLRIFTINAFVPTQDILEFSSAEAVTNYFGASEEAERAIYYFGFQSKTNIKPDLISFSRWVDVATPPQIFGNLLANTAISFFQAITNGSFTLTMGGDTNLVSGINFSTATNLNDVASILETAIQAETGTQFPAAQVVFNNIHSAFDLTGGVAANAVISVAPGTVGTDIATIIGWLPKAINGIGGAVWSDGSIAESITDTLNKSQDISNNFATFLFTTEAALTQSEITEAATWNAGINVKYIYTVGVTPDLITSYATDLAGYAGLGISNAPDLAALDPDNDDEFPEILPAAIFAATDYTAPNATQNFMFQISSSIPLTPSVVDADTSNLYDSLRINYYGQTQQAGRNISFYQRGLLMGGSNAPKDWNTYANEIWLKDVAGVSIMNLLLAVNKVPANASGRIMILAILQPVIDQALLNGVISVGKALTPVQIATITLITDDTDAWRQVQNSGYWINCTIDLNTQTNEYEANYLLVYSKDDVIRKVNGTHTLI